MRFQATLHLHAEQAKNTEEGTLEILRMQQEADERDSVLLITKATLVMKVGYWSRKRKKIFERDLKIFERFRAEVVHSTSKSLSTFVLFLPLPIQVWV